jgi:NAD(P)-dependent dehydrogenase (short-subunit alcohol dehydrogenase family)
VSATTYIPRVGYSLQDKNVLVTGASSGIGAALAEGFARRGATVGMCARRAELLDDVLDRVRAHAPASRSWIVDLSDLDAADAFAREANAALGGIDVLVNNAGIPKRRTVFDLTADVVEDVMRINYFSPVRLMLTLRDTLVERGGRIVNISSVAARLSPPAEAAYAATKAAISAWSECMQVDLRDTDVKLHVVYPGVIDTQLFHLPDNDAPVAQLDPLPVEDMVEPVLQMIENDTFEIAVPDWFTGIFAGKYHDVAAFLDGTVTWLRSETG